MECGVCGKVDGCDMSKHGMGAPSNAAGCSVPDPRVQRLVDACREWRDYMFRRMPRDVAMRRAENPGTHKIVAALDAFE